jgi:hypothetical protein
MLQKTLGSNFEVSSIFKPNVPLAKVQMSHVKGVVTVLTSLPIRCRMHFAQHLYAHMSL